MHRWPHAVRSGLTLHNSFFSTEEISLSNRTSPGLIPQVWEVFYTAMWVHQEIAWFRLRFENSDGFILLNLNKCLLSGQRSLQNPRTRSMRVSRGSVTVANVFTEDS